MEKHGMTDPTQLIETELLPKERILWSGQPTKKTFSGSDIFMVPFSLMWGGFAIFWETLVLSQDSPGFFVLWGIPFVAMGLYFIFGRFIYKRYRQKRTYYYVTNQRAIVLTDTGNKKVEAAFLNAVPAINKSVGSGGVGTIRFGNTNLMSSFYGNTGMEFFGGMYGTASAPTFYDVPNADNIYQLASQARQG